MKILAGVVMLGCSAGEEADKSRIEVMRDSIVSKERNQVELAKSGSDFREELRQLNLEPSAGVQKRIASSGEIASLLLSELESRQLSADANESRIVANAVGELLAIIDSQIEEGYQTLPVRANVMPPAGVPGAAPGMNPYSIEDAGLRDKYLELIAAEQKKQWKNVQQRELRSAQRTILIHISSLEAWREKSALSKRDFIERFTKEGKSRAELEKRILQPDGE